MEEEEGPPDRAQFLWDTAENEYREALDAAYSKGRQSGMMEAWASTLKQEEEALSKAAAELNERLERFHKSQEQFLLYAKSLKF